MCIILTSSIFHREEELIYLEFIADVTNEILMLGLYNDRFVHFLPVHLALLLGISSVCAA